MKIPALQKLLDLARAAVADGSLVRLTLGAPRGGDRSLKNVQVRAIELRGEPHLTFVYHHATRDITKNFPVEDGLALLAEVIGTEFRTAHLFTTKGTAQLEIRDGRGARLLEGPPQHNAAPAPRHDQARQRLVPTDRPWLRALGVVAASGQITRGMEAKYRQVDKFVEIFSTLARDAKLENLPSLRLFDMGCGKGYLTFAVHDWLQHVHFKNVHVCGIEARPELVDLCNGVVRDNALEGLEFSPGRIADRAPESCDVLIALHACNTATDDAIARGISAGARLIVVSPCCHQELRPQLVAPPVLEGALRHGILRERQAEFVTDALRAALLEWAGFETRVFEFISTEHTAKNLMIAALRRENGPAQTPDLAARVRALAAEYGIRHQTLAAHLGVNLS